MAPRLENTPFQPFTTLNQSAHAVGVPSSNTKTGTTITMSKIEKEIGNAEVSLSSDVNLRQSLNSASFTMSVDTGIGTEATTKGGGGVGSLLNGMSLTPMGGSLVETVASSGASVPPILDPSRRALPPRPTQTADVSLSARSFNERLLVGMRDTSIEVGQEQVRSRPRISILFLLAESYAISKFQKQSVNVFCSVS